jgi:CubicO group peptidase (beta-lactamase class C family)
MASALNVRTMITRRASLLLTAAAAGSLLTARGGAHSSGSESAAETRLPELASSLDEGVRSGRLQNLHAAVVVHRDEMLLERYYEGTDEWWGFSLGTVNFGPTVKHDIRSSSKSVVGLLYGIALHAGKVPDLDAPLIEQFPELHDLASDAVHKIRVKHALSMSMGLEWPEDRISYADPRNPEIAMYLATDQYRYIFSRPVMTAPGQGWLYCGGATAILGHLIARGTDTPLFAYAHEKIFRPLGITQVQWVGGTDGEVAAASGLRMCPRDFARLGQLVLKGGRWDDTQVVPKKWLDEIFTPRVRIATDVEYGYQWYLINGRDGHRWLGARGNGGQYLTVIPDLDLVVALVTGNYNKGGSVSDAALADYILPKIT